MKLDAQQLFLIQSLIPKHRGVFSASDLKAVFLVSDAIALARKVKPFLEAKGLFPFCRVFYVAPGFDPEWLSRRICPHSAISLGTVLAKEALIGSIPAKTVYAVKIGKSRHYRSSLGQVVHLGFSSVQTANDMWFGYDRFENGINYADKEKAFLDTLYFYQLGHKFSFNVYHDIAVDRLSRPILESYLARYKNPKFQTFVKGVIDGQYSI